MSHFLRIVAKQQNWAAYCSYLCADSPLSSDIFAHNWTVTPFLSTMIPVSAIQTSLKVIRCFCLISMSEYHSAFIKCHRHSVLVYLRRLSVRQIKMDALQEERAFDAY